MKEQLALLPEYLGAHLRLTLAALLVGLLISVPLGVLVTRRRWLERPVLGVASIIQTIPSLALLAVMVPLLAAAGFRSIGFLPAFLGLVLYSILPILRNTVTGISGVDPAFIEAARGVGMTPRQQLLRVELPLAMPVIIAGVRTSTVWTVGVATLSTPVGATSLGNYIFSGLQTRNSSAVFVGCAAAAALALALDVIVRLAARSATHRQRRTRALGLVALSILGVGSVVPFLARSSPHAERIVVGSKTFTEQYVLSELLRGAIIRKTGLETDAAQSLGSSVVFDALRSGAVDTYVDYSGTIWTTVLHRTERPSDRGALIAEIRHELKDIYGIELVASLGFENAYALAMTRRRAEALGVKSVSDLARALPNASIGGDYEFFARPEWKALEATYRLVPSAKRSMDSSLMYQAVALGEVDAISAFSTDGRIAAMDLVVLVDDRGAIPPYDAIILASTRLAVRHPEVVAALRELDGAVNDSTMRRMNLAVDQGHEAPEMVAKSFLSRQP